MCKVFTGAGLVKKKINNVSKSFNTFPSLVMKQKGDQDFRHIITLTFFSTTNMIEFGNTDMWFILLPN